jgi:pilus assembly protein Flp/PilA
MNRKWERNMGRRFLVDERGATAIEYALIAAGISVAIVVTLANVGSSVKAMWITISNAL